MLKSFKKPAAAIWQAIQSARRVLLTLHPDPDPDSVGSNLACFHALCGLGKAPVLVKGDSPLPEYLSFLPGYEAIVPKTYSEIDLATFDLFLILDISSPDRISASGEVIFPPGLQTVLIDHHGTAQPFCRINLIALKYPATAEILYDLFLDWGVTLTPEIAINLFFGLYGDTGGFKYRGTTARTFRAAARLVRLAPQFPDLIFRLENNRTPGELRFEGLALSAIEVIGAGQAALVALGLKDLAARGLRFEDAQGVSIANLLKSVRDWQIGVLLLESAPGEVKVSLRTRDAVKFDVSKLAVALGGGGHAAAAGAVLKFPLAQAKKLFLEKLVAIYPELKGEK